MKLTFMGTAGARFMVAKQIAASGGLYLEEGDTRISLDPGPGAVVQYAKRKVDLTKLDAIVISHRRLFCPGDALDRDPVVLNYLRHFPQEIVRLQPETDYSVNGVNFTTSPAHLHQVETFGFRFGDRLGWVTDSEYYEGIAEQHKAGVMVIHLVLMECRTGLPHLCLADVERIIRDAKPRLAIITHFGMTVWRAHPWEVAADLTQRLGTEVKAARDGMSIEL
ncbi:MAG: MBL fold metallo-hydrolase [Chloroflexi bacterium]|nr:MAG: MBL fold metallo-hydrolase [Chloroflexota bacterium]